MLLSSVVQTPGLVSLWGHREAPCSALWPSGRVKWLSWGRVAARPSFRSLCQHHVWWTPWLWCGTFLYIQFSPGVYIPAIEHADAQPFIRHVWSTCRRWAPAECGRTHVTWKSQGEAVWPSAGETLQQSVAVETVWWNLPEGGHRASWAVEEEEEMARRWGRCGHKEHSRHRAAHVQGSQRRPVWPEPWCVCVLGVGGARCSAGWGQRGRLRPCALLWAALRRSFLHPKSCW